MGHSSRQLARTEQQRQRNADRHTPGVVKAQRTRERNTARRVQPIAAKTPGDKHPVKHIPDSVRAFLDAPGCPPDWAADFVAAHPLGADENSAPECVQSSPRDLPAEQVQPTTDLPTRASALPDDSYCKFCHEPFTPKHPDQKLCAGCGDYMKAYIEFTFEWEAWERDEMPKCVYYAAPFAFLRDGMTDAILTAPIPPTPKPPKEEPVIEFQRHAPQVLDLTYVLSVPKLEDVPFYLSEAKRQRLEVIEAVDTPPANFLTAAWERYLLAGMSQGLATDPKHWQRMKRQEARWHAAKGELPPQIAKKPVTQQWESIAA